MPAPSQVTGSLVVTEDLVIGGSLTYGSGTVGNSNVAAGANLSYSKIEHLHNLTYHQARNPQTQRMATTEFDLDNGAGTTVDQVVCRPTAALTITAARIIYSDATTGTVAAGNAKIGTTVGGAEIVAATAYGNTAAVGTQTSMTIVSGAVAAATPVIVRHTGVAATQAGKAIVEMEFTNDADTNNEVFDTTVPLNISAVTAGTLVSIDAKVDTLPTSTKTHSVDLQKSTAGGAFATVLSAPIALDAADTARVPVAGAISDAATIDGDQYQLVVSSSGSGVNGRRLQVTVRYAEETT
jgi:hypothetical protein